MPLAFEDKRFRMISPLGRGGTADVARVYVGDLGSEVALKYPIPDNSSSASDFASLARREYDLIGGQRFPGLVRLIEPPHTEPDYLLLELCEGMTLDTVGRVEDIPTALRLLSAVALTLEYLRARNLVHGDLKPHNIFLPRRWDKIPCDRLFYAKLSDFSLGRKADEPESSRAGLGTVGYMAPEVVGRQITSHQSDLFAFGVIAYQVLTGVHPFLKDDAEPVRVNGRIQEDLVPSIGTLRPELIGHPVAILVDQLLAKQSTERPATAYDVCLALESAGSTYPFNRGIRPGHLLLRDDTFELASERILDLSPTDRRQLSTFTGTNVRDLTLLLSSNFSQGNLEYRRGQYRFVSGVHWPAYLRRGLWVDFMKLALNRKRQLIQQAVSFATNGVTTSELPLLVLLRQLLKSSTVRRISLREAPKSERSEEQSRAAVLWLQAGQLEQAERCAYQAATILAKENRWQESLETLDRVIDFASMQTRVHEVAELMLLKGTVLKDSGDTISAEATYKELIEALKFRPVTKTLGMLYNKLGDLYKMRSDFEAGLATLQKALPIFEQLGDELEYSHTCNNLGNIYWVIGDISKSSQQYRHALHLQRKLNARTDIASTLSNLGSVQCMAGRMKRGLFLLNLSLAIKREVGNGGEIARTLNNLGYVSYVTGESNRAIDFLSESLDLNKRVGSRKEIMINLENLSSIMVSSGRIHQSIRLLREGLEMSRELEDRYHEVFFCAGMANAFVRLGQLGEAHRLLADTEHLLNEIDDRGVTILHCLASAHYQAAIDNLDLAEQLARRAMATARECSDAHGELQAVLLLKRLTTCPELSERTESLLTELHFDRMRPVLHYNESERCLRVGDMASAIKLIENDMAVPLSSMEDGDTPRLCLIAAECLLSEGESTRAIEYLGRARRLASESGLVAELISTMVMLGRLSMKESDFETAFSEFKSAIQLAKQTSQTISVESDRAVFQKKREIQYLVTEVKRLGLILGQKNRAGVEPARA